MTFNNEDIKKIITKYLEDVERLGQSEDYHDLEDFAYYYGGLLPEKSFVNLMMFLQRYFSLIDQGI